MMVFTLLSTKGGVGKTTCSANLAALYADMGYRVLLIDTDASNPSVSNYFERATTAPHGITDLMITGELRPDMISTLAIPPSEGTGDARKGRTLNERGRLDLIYSDAGFALKQWLDRAMNPHKRLQKALRSPLALQNYDIAIVDTEGASGKIQDAAAFAADRIILPVTPDALSSRAFIADTLDVIERIAQGHETDRMSLSYALLYRVANTNSARSYSDSIREEFSDLKRGVSVMNSIIRHAEAFQKSSAQRLPVHWLDRRAHAMMHRLAWELIPQTEGFTDGTPVFDADPAVDPPANDPPSATEAA